MGLGTIKGKFRALLSLLSMNGGVVVRSWEWLFSYELNGYLEEEVHHTLAMDAAVEWWSKYDTTPEYKSIRRIVNSFFKNCNLMEFGRLMALIERNPHYLGSTEEYANGEDSYQELDRPTSSSQ